MVVPARTNEFQRLVTVLHEKLSAGWLVTESKPLWDRVIEEDREVDVVIEGEAGAYAVVLSIECRDRSRAADVTWVEEMHTKHEHLPTNKLVLVSATGFSKAARRKASALGIELLELVDAEVADWASIATRLSELFMQYVRSDISVSVEVDRANGQREYERVGRDTPLVVEGAEGSIPIGALADHIARMPELGNVVLDHVQAGEEKDLWARYVPPVAVSSIDSTGQQRRVHSIAVGIHATGSMATVKLRSGLIGDSAVAFGVADFGHEQIHLSVVERQNTPVSITMLPWPTKAT